MIHLRRIAAPLLAALVVGVFPGAAFASCGSAHQVNPKPPAWPKNRRPALMIGDSTSLLALEELAERGIMANGKGCRQTSDAIEMIRLRRNNKRLPGVVAIALGPNGPVTTKELAVMRRIMGPSRHLVLITPRLSTNASDRRAMIAFARRNRQTTTVLDWARYSKPHPGWFQPDSLHTTINGGVLFARFIARSMMPIALRYAGLVQTPTGPKPKPAEDPGDPAPDQPAPST